MASISPYKVGQLIELGDGRQCVIRFLGQTSFAPGDWVGVELENDSGKNDGSVQGERYFECDMGHGMFLRPAAVAKVLEDPTPKPSKKVAVTAEAKATKPASRLSTTSGNAARRQTAADPTAVKRAAMNSASPTPGLRRQSVLNGHKSPTKLASRAVGSTATSSAASSRGVTPPTTSRNTQTAPRSSLVSRAARPSAAAGTTSNSTTPASRAAKSIKAAAVPSSRASGTGSAASVSRMTNASSSRLSSGPVSKVAPKTNGVRPVTKQNSGTSLASQPRDRADTREDDVVSNASTEGEKKSDTDKDSNDAESQDSGDEGDANEAARAPISNCEPALQPAQRTAALARKVEEYEAKLRLLEKKRSDDVEKLVNLEKLQGEKEKLERIIQTLQAKLKPQSQELTTARSRIKELEEQIGNNEGVLGEHESEMEMAMLDREMAEEMAEALKLELEMLKQKQEELELEVEVLREENAEFGKDSSPEEQSTRGWLQMERQNERYREALVRLRDVSQSTEAELKEHISALKEDLQQLEGIKEQHDAATEQLRQSESAIEDLKQQLEAALASEDMVEELTETNNNLSEDNRRLKVEIDDLQTINEINDEFELQRIENEKQMQGEIDTRGAALVEHANIALKQEEKLVEYEYTINKFREVVTNLHSNIEDLKASRQISDAEADELNLRSKAMTDLNLRLHVSAAKAQVNTVDLETRRLEAQEAAEHLEIVQMFLPDGFKQERDSILVYLRFKRVGFKARLFYDLLKDRISGSSFRVSSEGVFVYCRIMDKLLWISAMCGRFVNDIKGCSLERFATYERALPELDPVERALNSYIELWKKDEMKETKVAEELQRTMALLAHLSEVHIEENLATYADDIFMKTSLIHTHLETTATALTLAKAVVDQAKPSGEDQDDPSDNVGSDTHLEQLGSLISQSRSAKVTATKVVAAVEELRTRSMALKPEASETFAECLSMATNTSSNAAFLGSYIYKASDDTSGLDVPFGTSVRNAMSEFRASCFPDAPASSDPLMIFGDYMRQTTSRLTSLHALVSELSNTTEFVRPQAPWVLRAEALISTSLNNVTAEAEVQRLKDALHERITTLRTRDQALEEQNVKIELLEARMRDANTKAKRIEELQRHIDGYKKREREMMQEMEKKFREAESLKTDRDRWKATADQRYVEGSLDQRGSVHGEKAVATVKQIETMRMEIKGLQGAVRYLRNDTLHSQHVEAKTSETVAWLSEPLLATESRRKEMEKREKMEKEGTELFRSLIYLTTSTRVVDLGRLPKNKLAWRPAKEKTSWIAARQSEDWESWNRRRRTFADRAQQLVGAAFADQGLRHET